VKTSLIGGLHMAATFGQLMPVDSSIGEVNPAPQPLSFFKKTAVLAAVLPRFTMRSGRSGVGWCQQHGMPERRRS
jgi:hypothetical protein